MKRLLILALLASFMAAWAFAQADLQPAATINLTRTEVITVRQLRAEVERMEVSARRPLTAQERRELLDVMINERLAVQAAERDRVTVSENEINQHLQQVRNQMAQQIGRQPTEAEFNQAVRTESGLDIQAFREQLRRQMVVQKYLMTQKQSLIESIRIPTEEEIVSTFNLSRSDFVRPETVRFSMIQVPFGADAAAKTRARELADRLAREIGGNASKFDEVSLRGQAANSGYQAGDGGYLPRNREAAQIVGQEFINAAFGLSQGEVSRVIEGQIAYQIIKITETYAMRNLELDDIFQPGSRMTVRDYIGNVLLQQRQQVVLAQATLELVTELRAGRTFQVFDRNLSW